MSVRENQPTAARIAGLILCILLILATASGGCIGKILPKNSETDQYPGAADTNDTAFATNAGDSQRSPELTPAVTVAVITPVKSEIVTEVAPFVTPDPYPVMHATRINETPIYRFIDRTPEFEKTYVMRGNATGILVNVVEGPLCISYVVDPQNDCLKDPESCRGDKEKPVQRPYLTITVRDNVTWEILAEDGYAREFSSDIGDYEITMSGQNMDGLTSSGGSVGTNTVYPGPRRIMIYKEGVFYITMEGDYLDVDLSIITGSSPDPLEIGSEKAAGTSAAPTPAPEDEGEWG